MSNIFTIDVTNNSGSIQDFYIFQMPAIYTGGLQVYSNSIFHKQLGAASQGGGVMECQINLQFYAGAQEETQSLCVGRISGDITTSQPVILTPATGVPVTNNATLMTIDPLMLSPPYVDKSVPVGAFQISTPVYNPGPDGNYNIGSAIQSAIPGTPAIMSNFVVAQPNKVFNCKPALIFYVAVGDYSAGTVIDFTTASTRSAICDSATGYQKFVVSYNSNGTWTVTNTALTMAMWV